MSIRDTSGSLKLLPCNSRETPFTEDMYTRYHQSLTAKKDNQSLQQHTCSQPHNITLYNLSGRRDEEGLLLQSILQEYPKIELIVRNQNIAQYIIAQLSLQANITAFQVFPPEAFISPQAVYDAITSQELLERKEVIFLIRLGFWLHRTKT